MHEWSVRDVDCVWDEYTAAIEELAASGTCDVLAHPDLVKVAGFRPVSPDECLDRLAEAAGRSGMAAECSSAGLRKPVGEIYPSVSLLQRFVDADVAFTTASDAHQDVHVADHSADSGSPPFLLWHRHPPCIQRPTSERGRSCAGTSIWTI